MLRCGLSLLLWLGSGAAFAHAQVGAPSEERSGAPAASTHDGSWLRLSELRLLQRDARRREGLTLFVWGALNSVGGAIAAGVKHDDRAWLAGSVTSLGFGLINALLALPLLDLSGARRAAILRDRARGGAGFEALRDKEAAAQLKSGQVFALNAGLDVFYLATGAFLLALAQRGTRHADWERGVGAAFLGQGAFLLGFDIACWIGSNRRAEALRGLR